MGVGTAEEGLIFTTKTIKGLIYDPSYVEANAAGFIQLTELELANALVNLQEESESRAVAMTAFLAVQDAKKRSGIALDCDDMSGVLDKPAPDPS